MRTDEKKKNIIIGECHIIYVLIKLSFKLIFCPPNESVYHINRKHVVYLPIFSFFCSCVLLYVYIYFVIIIFTYIVLV